MNFIRIRRIAAVAAIAAFTAPAVASATPALRNVTLASVHTAFLGALDVQGGSTALGAKVIQYPVNGATNQRWDLVHVDPATDGSRVYIVNDRSGMCLTTNGVDGAQLYQWTCNGGARQIWSADILGQAFTKNQPGLIYNAATNLYVDVEGASGLAGTRVVGYHRTGKTNQQFGYYQF